MAGSNNNVKILLVVVLFLAAAAIFIKTQRPPAGPGDGAVYFYDLTTGELLAVPLNAAGDQNRGVRSYVYACGECSTPSRKIGYLTSISAEAQAMMKRPLDQVDSAVIERGRLIALPPEKTGDDLKWVPQNTPAGAEIRRVSAIACAGAKPAECLPGR